MQFRFETDNAYSLHRDGIAKDKDSTDVLVGLGSVVPVDSRKGCQGRSIRVKNPVNDRVTVKSRLKQHVIVKSKKVSGKTSVGAPKAMKSLSVASKSSKTSVDASKATKSLPLAEKLKMLTCERKKKWKKGQPGCPKCRYRDTGCKQCVEKLDMVWC